LRPQVVLNALRAAATARSTSLGPALATLSRTSPVAGLTVSKVLPSCASTCPIRRDVLSAQLIHQGAAHAPLPHCPTSRRQLTHSLLIKICVGTCAWRLLRRLMDDMLLVLCWSRSGCCGELGRRRAGLDKARRVGRVERGAGADPSRARRAGPILGSLRPRPAPCLTLQQASHSAATEFRAAICSAGLIELCRRVTWLPSSRRQAARWEPPEAPCRRRPGWSSGSHITSLDRHTRI
jgi:hypothetical protein